MDNDNDNGNGKQTETMQSTPLLTDLTFNDFFYVSDVLDVEPIDFQNIKMPYTIISSPITPPIPNSPQPITPPIPNAPQPITPQIPNSPQPSTSYAHQQDTNGNKSPKASTSLQSGDWIDKFLDDIDFY